MSDDISLSCDSFTFDPRPDYPLLITLNRYTPPPHLVSTSPTARTLVLAHGTGFHKEQWEPALRRLIVRSPVPVREAWVIDAPNHGDAAILNENVLQYGYCDIFPWEDYGRALHCVLANLGTGIPVNFSTRTVVGVGHSMGAVGLILSTTYTPRIAYTSLILAEPMIFNPGGGRAMSSSLQAGVARRRDIWPSRAEALQALQAGKGWQAWDGEVLKLFAEKGLRDLPTLDYPNEKSGVTLKCSKIQEAATYRDSIGRLHAFRLLRSLAERLPVHVVYGAVDDYIPRDAKDEVCNVAAAGRFSSVVRVEGAGHLIVQTHPRALAEALATALGHPTSVRGAEGAGAKL